jgi:exodeoxyribonuclease X
VKITDATFCLIDTETSGIEEGCDLLEVATHTYRACGTEPGPRFTALVKPTKPIPPEASGIHGLIDEDFEHALPRAEVMAQFGEFVGDTILIPVAHNAEFDSRIVPEVPGPWLCSERMAHHLTPAAPNFKLQTLRYYYGFKHLDVGGAHRADADLLVLAPVFFHLVALYRAWAEKECAGDLDRLAKAEEVETLLAWAKRPYVLARPAFGKYKTWDELLADDGYVGWMLRLPDLSTEMRWNIDRERKLRRA